MDGIVVRWLNWWWCRRSTKAFLCITDLADTMTVSDLRKAASYLQHIALIKENDK